MDKTVAIIGGVVAVALIVAYAVVTATGHDADALLGVLAGYLGGAGTHAAVTAVKGTGAST